MADITGKVMQALYCCIALVGTTLNLLTMNVLVRDENLRKKLASVRWLMFSQSLCEFIVCCIGTPLNVISLFLGPTISPDFAPPWCWVVALTFYTTARTSYWYHAVLAFTRLAAVLMPAWYRKHLKTKRLNLLLCILPWLIAYAVYAVGALAKAYRVDTDPGSKCD